MAKKAAGFDGHIVSLGVYSGEITKADLDAFGTAKVEKGVTTFPHVGDLSTGKVTLADPSVDFSGNQITIQYPGSEDGLQFLDEHFNGFVFKVPKDLDIKHVTLEADNMGLLPSDIHVIKHHEITVNFSGLTLPIQEAAMVELSVTFG